MIVVTGGAGFIGSRLVKTLNNQGLTDILIVDDLSNGHKFANIVDCEFYDYMDKEDFIVQVIEQHDFAKEIEVIFHQGACSNTTEWDGHYMMKNNYEYSKILFHYCADRDIPFIYASSAAVYGASKDFAIDPKNEKPLNVYGFSKLQFDRYVRKHPTENQVVGLRYFNVYGPGESHKGQMASVAYHFHNQLKDTGVVKLFAGCDGYGDGEQLRDFVYVDDVVNLNIWFWKNPQVSGIFNAGTGKSQTFNDVANAVIGWHGKGNIEYILFPDKLRGVYQSFTQANLTMLRESGYQEKFQAVEQAVPSYLSHMGSDPQ